MTRFLLIGALAACVASIQGCHTCPRTTPVPVNPVALSSLPPGVFLLADPRKSPEALLGKRVRASAFGHIVLLDALPGALEGAQLHRAPDVSLPPTLTRAGWLAYHADSDAEVVRLDRELRNDETFVEYELSEVERVTLEGAPTPGDSIVQAVLVGKARTRCPPLAGLHCRPETLAQASIAIVVGTAVGPWAELLLPGDPARIDEAVALPVTVAALPGDDLVLRLREADGSSRTLWRATAQPDHESRATLRPADEQPIAPLHRFTITPPSTASTTARCARLELDVIAAPSRADIDAHGDGAAWERFVASLPVTRWRRITRDVVVAPAAAAEQPIEGLCSSEPR